MKQTYLESELFCIHCLDETVHKITYINDQITKVECEECHSVLELRVDLMKEFFRESYNRIATKPSRITKEYKEDLSHFLLKLPIRIMTKPYRVAKDINGVRNIIRDYK
ncbi:bh protein [Aquibacillus sp. 3ASR75-11]|uniref:Bh protein n=1 Tax=Terrihalobacillus insolitus TaxID=2950438 RepID=A0A9X3WV20_9BACI|nr:bh protein [Terrihalobacillus insolitus]MDC3424576.1 bh protein [Terrihalobacillus insolitus]